MNCHFLIPVADKKISLTVYKKNQMEYVKKNYYSLPDSKKQTQYSINFAPAKNKKLLIEMSAKKIDIFCPNHFKLKYLDLIFKISTQLLFFKQILMLHGSSLVINNLGYIFSGRSGAGKSTIVRGQKNILSDEAGIIQIKNGKFYVYPSPFDKGKARIQYGSKYLLEAIFFIKQAKVNKTFPISSDDAFVRILENSYINQLYQVQIKKNTGEKPVIGKKIISLKTKNIFLQLWRLTQSVKIMEMRFSLNLGFLKNVGSQYG